MESFLRGEQSLAGYLGGLGADLAEIPDEWVPDLSRRDMSYDFIWAWCRAAKLFGRSLKLTPPLCELLRRDDHQAHEEITDALQDLRDPTTVDCLYERAVRRLAYLSYNDSASLARRYVWALHDIGTPEALARLKLLAEDRREEVADEARARLSALASRRPGKAPEPYRVARDRELGSL